MARYLKNWVEGYIEYLEKSSESPTNYLFWSAATAIASVMKRHCWIDRGTYRVIPNMYTILVGRAGIGKGSALNPAMGLLRKSGCVNILSDRLTIPYVLERLSKGFPSSVAFNKITGGVSIGIDSSAIIFSPELAVFIHSSVADLPNIADIWDYRDGKFQYGTRMKGMAEIDNPCLSILAGSTPTWLVEAIPSNAVGGGFTRRVNFVYAKDKGRSIPFPDLNGSVAKQDKLINDLQHIHVNCRGEYKLADKQTEDMFLLKYREWETTDEFEDESISSFRTTKFVHVLKLAMALSASEEDSGKIQLHHLSRAILEVDKVEDDLKTVFRSVGDSDMAGAMDRVMKYLEIKGYASREEILSVNWKHFGSSELDIILTTLIQAGMIHETQRGNKCLYQLLPQKPRRI